MTAGGWQLLHATSDTSWAVALTDGVTPPAPVPDIQVENSGLRLLVSSDRSFPTGAPIRARSWDFGDGSPAVTTSSADHVYARPGSYDVTLSLTDQTRNTVSLKKTVNMLAATRNRPPVARFTAVALAGAVQVDASASYDPDGAVTNFDWSWGDGTGGSGVQPPPHTYPDVGDYPVTLTVTDRAGQTAYLTKVVTIVEAAPAPASNTPPTASFTTSVVGTTVTINAAASSDPDGKIVSYAIAWGDGTTGSGAGASHDYGKAGTWQITLTVTDDRAAFSALSKTVTTTAPATAPAPAPTPTPTPTPTPSPSPTPSTLYTAGSMYQDIPSSIRVYTFADLGLSTSVTDLQQIVDALPAEGIIQLPGGGWTGTIPNFGHHASNYGINQTRLLGLLGVISGGQMQTRIKLAGKAMSAAQLSSLASASTGTTPIAAYRNASGKSHYLAGLIFQGADQQEIQDYTNPAGKTAPARYGGFSLNKSGPGSVFQNILMQGFGRADASSPPGEIGNWSESHTSGFLFRRVEHDGRLPGAGSDPYAMGWRRGGGIQWNQAAGYLMEDVYTHDTWSSGYTSSFTSLPSGTANMSHDFTTRRLRVADNSGWGTSSVTGQASGTFPPINMEFCYGTVHHYQPQLDQRTWTGRGSHIKLWMQGTIGGTAYTGQSSLQVFVHQPKWSSSNPLDNGCFSIDAQGFASSGMAKPVVYLLADETKPATAFVTAPGKQVPSYVTPANNYYVLKES